MTINGDRCIIDVGPYWFSNFAQNTDVAFEGITLTSTGTVIPDHGSFRIWASISHFIRCAFENFQGGSFAGAAIHIYADEEVSFEECIFRNNIATNRGGAVWLTGSNAIFKGCTFESNQAGAISKHAVSFYENLWSSLGGRSYD